MFQNWRQWEETWKVLKNSKAAEEIHLKPDFYRCTSHDCSYTTMNASEFNSHILVSHPGEDLFCSYCLKRLPSPETLISHSEKHRSWIYQCSHCIYRAITPAHVLMHWRSLHGESEVEQVWKLPWQQPFDKTFKLSDEYIKPFLCKECPFKTRNISEFGLHQAVHPSVSCFQCSCATPSFNTLLVHLRICHRIYEFHCYFCRFADTSAESVFLHISINHPGKPLQLCSRVEVEIHENEIRKTSSGEIKSQSQITGLENIENDPTLLTRLSNNTSKTVPLHTSKLLERKTSVESVISKQKTTENLKDNALPNTNIVSKEATPNISCPDCKNMYSSRKDLSNHLMFEHNKTNLEFCVTSTTNLEAHRLQKNSVTADHCGFKNRKPDSSTVKYLCVFCNFVSNSHTEMAEHLRGKIVEKVTTDLTRQNQAKDPRIEKWIINYLKAQDPEQKNIVRKYKPMKIKKTRESHTMCPMCSSKHISAVNTLLHLSRHLQYKPYTCRHCAFDFQTYTGAMKHGENVHSDLIRPFECFPTSFINTWMKRLIYGEDRRLWPVASCGVCRFNDLDLSIVMNHFEEKHPGVKLCIKNNMSPEANKSKIVAVPLPAFGASSKECLQNRQVLEEIGESALLPNDVSERPSHSVLLNDTSGSTGNLAQHSRNEMPSQSSPTCEYQKNTNSMTAQFYVAKEPSKESTVEQHSSISGGSNTDVDDESSDSANTFLKCSICVFSTKDLATFKDHCKSEHSVGNNKRKASHDSSKVPQKTSKSSSLKSGADFDSDSQVSNSRNLIRCPLCRYLTSSATKLSIHTKKKHTLGNLRPTKPLTDDDQDDKATLATDKEVSRKNEDHYTSRYGKKPEPIDFQRLYIAVPNPGETHVSVSLELYRDVFFRREMKIVLTDCNPVDFMY